MPSRSSPPRGFAVGTSAVYGTVQAAWCLPPPHNTGHERCGEDEQIEQHGVVGRVQAREHGQNGSRNQDTELNSCVSFARAAAVAFGGARNGSDVTASQIMLAP